MKKWFIRSGWMAAGIAALYAVSALAGAALGGPLDPPGPPSGTMKTLDEIPCTWSRLLSDGGADSCNTPRFTCVLGGGGVRDNETGLVWEKSPTTELLTWSAAQIACVGSAAGGRGGWRLPTDVEVRSLLDPNAANQPLLPDNHPFDIYVPHGYVWTSSPVPIETDLAYAVDTDTLDRNPSPRGDQYKKWCVRGVQADAPEDSELAEQPPAWYRTLDATGGCFSERFRCVMNNEAVLDRETGLVWQRTPFNAGYKRSWIEAFVLCGEAEPGGRSSWRLPTREELSSLWDPVAAFPGLPAGNPFDHQIVSLEVNVFWTRTEWAGGTESWAFMGNLSSYSLSNPSDYMRVWCVRAPGASVEDY